jgi:hypothetical protein
MKPKQYLAAAFLGAAATLGTAAVAEAFPTLPAAQMDRIAATKPTPDDNARYGMMGLIALCALPGVAVAMFRRP